MKTMLQPLLFFLIMTVLTGVIYPSLVTGIAKVAWAEKSAGSLVKQGDQILGSSLLAQKFSRDHYFWPRPSASDYQALPSGASNLGPTSKVLRDQIAHRRKLLSKAHGQSYTQIPELLLTTSASGLDPHLSREAALFQCGRIAKARKLDENGFEQLVDMVEKAQEQPLLSVLGPRVINIFLLNVAVDRAFGKNG